MIDVLLESASVMLLGRVLVHSLWQGVAIAIVLATLLWILTGVSSNGRYYLSLSALLTCLLLPMFTLVYFSTATSSSPRFVEYEPIPPTYNVQRSPMIDQLLMADASALAKPETVQLQPRSMTVRTLRRWKFKLEPLLPWLVLGWFLGIITLSLRLGLGFRSLQRLRSNFVLHVPPHIKTTVLKLSQRLELKQDVTIKLSQIVDVPLVVGFVKPLILVPVSVLNSLTPEQLELILAHELAHIKRVDPIINLLQNVVEIILFFNPAIWWISQQVRQEREYCCDAIAVAACQSNTYDYAQTLNQLNQLRIANTLRLAANGGSLLKRILKLVGKPLKPNPSHGLAGFGLLLLSLAIASVAMAQPQGGVLKVAFESMPQLDPYKSAGSGEINAFAQIFDQLVLPAPENYSPTPHLAESWESPDDTTWLFKLREGVVFQDGNDVFPEGANREVVAEDIVYSINRFLEISTVFTLGDIESVTALDKYTVELKTAQPDPFLLADPNRLARVHIVPREAIEQLGEEGFALNPIGSGPFEVESFIPDQELNLVRNEDYFVTPHLDGVEFVFIPDPTVQTIAVEAQDIDVVPYLFNIDSFVQLSDNPDLTLLPGAGSYRGLGVNVTTPPFDELAVRDAISKAMNIDAAVAAVIEPYGQRAYGQVPYWFEFEEDPELPGLWSHDPEGALEQLAEAGFTDSDGDGILDRDGEPLSFDIKTFAGSQTRVLTILVTQLKELGIDANVLQQDGAVWGEDLQTGNDTGIFFDYSFASLTGLYALFHGDNIGITNTHFYANPDVDALLDEASATLDFETRNDLWLEAQRIIMADRAAIPLYFENGYVVAGNYVKDVEPGAVGLQLVSLVNNAYLDQ
ncbi:MAG: ABC transporter substrate-binding protein [Deinococcota bacterium]